MSFEEGHGGTLEGGEGWLDGKRIVRWEVR